jgi:ribonuclease PH
MCSIHTRSELDKSVEKRYISATNSLYRSMRAIVHSNLRKHSAIGVDFQVNSEQGITRVR